MTTPASSRQGAIRDPALFPIADRVAAGQRLSAADAATLFRSPDLLGVGALADAANRARHGDVVTFAANQHINPTNVCVLTCKFCDFAARKAGHTGNLDVLASGLLPLCFGAATKFAQACLDADKRYRATLALGERTASGDRETPVVERREVRAEHLARDDVGLHVPRRTVHDEHADRDPGERAGANRRSPPA